MLEEVCRSGWCVSIVTVRKRVERAPEGRKLPLVEGKRLCDRKESLRKCVLLPSRVNHTHTHTHQWNQLGLLAFIPQTLVPDSGFSSIECGGQRRCVKDRQRLTQLKGDECETLFTAPPCNTALYQQ